MSRLFNHKMDTIQKGIVAVESNRYSDVPPESIDDALFVKASFDAQSVEKTGYSNYSYWRSTLQVFLKNPIAIFFLCLLTVMLVFTFVQPLLPGQKSPTKIYAFDDTGKRITNRKPYFTNELQKIAAGKTLTLADVGKTWATVENTIAKLPRNARVEALSETGSFTLVQTEDGEQGYVPTNVLRFDIEEGDDKKPYPKAGRTFSQAELTIYPAKEVFIATSDITLSEKAPGAKTVNAVINQNTIFRTERTTLAFWFGTNAIGQDLWSRIWSGTRTSLLIGVTVGLICALIGIVLGAIWGYVKKLDKVFTEVYNVIENIPTTVIRILITYIMRPSLSTIIFVMCITGWMGMARFIRNQIVIIRDREYNLASRCLGTGTFQMILRNILPYLVSVIMLRTAMAIPEAIGTEVFLTYIGLGLPVSLPSLGNLLNEGRLVMTDAALTYQLIFPAIIVSVITMSFYALGNAFADAADPRNHV